MLEKELTVHSITALTLLTPDFKPMPYTFLVLQGFTNLLYILEYHMTFTKFHNQRDINPWTKVALNWQD